MIIGIEGHSFTGKTTTLEAIRQLTDVVVIPETDRYAGGIENYPPFPALDSKMAQNNIDFFAGLEQRRKYDSDTRDGHKVLDRTFVSPLLFQKFIQGLDNDWVDSLDYGKGLYHDMVDRGDVIIPDAAAILTCANMQEYGSRTSREISVDALRSEEAYGFFTDQYMRIFEPYRTLGRLAVIVNHNNVPIEQASQQVLALQDLLSVSRRQKRNLAHEMIEAI